MGLVISPAIRKEEIFKKVDDAQIFTAYFGPFELGRRYKSVFRKDDNPSTGFYVGQSGKIIYNDLTTSEKLDCFSFVAKLHQVPYAEAIKIVAHDFGLIVGSSKRPKFEKANVSANQMKSEHEQKETEIIVEEGKLSGSYLNYWAQFGIRLEELVENEVIPIDRYYLNGVEMPNTSKNVRFCYIIRWRDKEYKKIYSPYADKKAFKWITNCPFYIPFGLNVLPYKSKTLFIVKAQKDRIIFKKYFTDVIAPQNESPAALREELVEHLKKRYDKIYINLDCDEPGLKNLERYEKYNFEPLLVPEVAYKNHGIKDFADFVKHYGLKRFEDFLKYKQLI